MDKEYKDRQEPVNRDENDQHARMDHPEQYATERESLFDRFESERHVDPIPVEDLTENMKDEQNKEHTKDSSSSEKKYRP